MRNFLNNPQSLGSEVISWKDRTDAYQLAVTSLMIMVQCASSALIAGKATS